MAKKKTSSATGLGAIIATDIASQEDSIEPPPALSENVTEPALDVAAAESTDHVLANNVDTRQSQYASPPVMLRIGSDLKPYWVPEILLQSLKDLPRSESPEDSIHLEDVDVEIGHVIVHFLFTGNYQLLHVDRGNMDGTSPDTSKVEFEKAIAIFVTAKSYQLTGLQKLAREEAERIGKEISVELAAHAVGEETLAVLSEDAAWLYSLVLRKAEQSFQEDHLLFSSATFFDGIKSIALAKILGQHVSGWYCQRVLQLDKVLDPPHESVEEVVIHTSQDRHDEPVNQPVETSPDEVNSFPVAEFAAQSGRDMAVSGVRVPAISVAAKRPNLEPLVETEIAQVNSERPALISIEKTCAFPLVAMPVMSRSVINAHYVSRTGPFVGLNKKERMQLKKMMRAQAAAYQKTQNQLKLQRRLISKSPRLLLLLPRWLTK
ncbi:hypothetical protein B5807_12097 [Epicoccum nigrum]|uniref:BTB domain-containing protein n=1 Tax=Epicoccum nigrum TaxID=105696 RepID=A0A1Y2LHD1_EPING|nr:hypothetical protein B5807_12097 [Epicoccum nigrum]